MAGHPNAPLTPEGRRRLCERVDTGRPIAHVAAEAGISRRCLAKWYARWREQGEDGLFDRSSRPSDSPARTAADIADMLETLRRQTKHGPARLAADLERLPGITRAPATVHRVLVRRGLNRLRDLDPPSGEQLRQVIRYEYGQPGDLVHVDIKKLGRIPEGGGWRMHGIGTAAARASKRAGPGNGKIGYTYLHSALDDHSHFRVHGGIGGRPPISGTPGSDYRVVFGTSLEPIDDSPRQLMIEDFVEPTSLRHHN
ncbi:helix-turn-helix domain-containing protein [Streptomyces sp. NRRL F-2580]|uniref:helix-turn-helix domain-containing protein n=1 Tax=Streptomyces sp. NRRL F-2580 TaxID=1463841 RepID=UPI00099D052A|nr:leucine zipper domain-containing protein [Streptomyces sp. NRRL F-2580]